MENIKEIESAIKLSRCKGVGAVVFKELIDKYKTPSEAYKIWQSKETIKLNFVSLNKNSTENLIEKTIEGIKNNRFCAYYYGDSCYPKSFYDLTEPPPIVYLSSKFKQMPFAAIVGTRNPDENQIKEAKQITLKLINDGYGIISGGAVGIDKIAIETTLWANGYPMVVLANGLDIVYPNINKELFEKVKGKGLLLSELMLGAQPQRGFFPTRNRLIVALADLVVAFPSVTSKGTLITIKLAKKLGKKVYCL